MSNLRLYQWMTTTAKKVGGPVNFMLIIASGGAVAYKGLEMSFKYLIKHCKPSKNQASNNQVEKTVYTVTSQYENSEGLTCSPEDKFRVLETDGDVILIEKVDDNNNPYVVSEELLRKISDYR